MKPPFLPYSHPSSHVLAFIHWLPLLFLFSCSTPDSKRNASPPLSASHGSFDSLRTQLPTVVPPLTLDIATPASALVSGSSKQAPLTQPDAHYYLGWIPATTEKLLAANAAYPVGSWVTAGQTALIALVRNPQAGGFDARLVLLDAKGYRLGSATLGTVADRGTLGNDVTTLFINSRSTLQATSTYKHTDYENPTMVMNTVYYTQRVRQTTKRYTLESQRIMLADSTSKESSVRVQ